MQEPITSFVLEAPAGPIRITAQCEQGKAKKITLRNAPAFVRPEDMELTIKVPKGDVGAVTVSVAYGGMWYAIVDAASVGLKIQLEDAAELVRIGEMIKIATMEQHPVEVLHTSFPCTSTLTVLVLAAPYSAVTRMEHRYARRCQPRRHGRKRCRYEHWDSRLGETGELDWQLRSLTLRHRN